MKYKNQARSANAEADALRAQLVTNDSQQPATEPVNPELIKVMELADTKSRFFDRILNVTGTA